MTSARPVEVPAMTDDELMRIYMPIYWRSRQSGKPNAKARQAAMRAVKAARKKRGDPAPSGA